MAESRNDFGRDSRPDLRPSLQPEYQREPRKAAALRYRPGDSAPRVVARGEDWLAEKIIDEAVRAGVPLANAPGLVNALLRCEVDDLIAPELYRVVAEILAWVTTLEPAEVRSDV